MIGTIHSPVHSQVRNAFLLVKGGGRYAVPATNRSDLNERLGRVTELAGPKPSHDQLFDASMQLTRHYADARLSDYDRQDSAGGSVNGPDDLVQEIRQVILQRHAPLNGRRLFPVSTQVRAGAQQYRQYRGEDTAEAMIYTGGDGSDVTRASVSNTHFDHGILYYISALEQGWFEDLTDRFTARTDTRARKVQAAVRALREIENKHTFQGGPGQFYGALHHPYVDHLISTIDWSTGDATPEVILAQLVGWANYAEQESESTYRPDTMAISVHLYNHISSLYIPGSDQTVLERFEKVCRHIRRVVPAREYNDAYGDAHGIHFFRGGAPGMEGDRSLQLEVVMPMTILPPDVRALSTTTFIVAGFGGLNQRQVGDCLTVAVKLS